jgi:hypothetical protein
MFFAFLRLYAPQHVTVTTFIGQRGAPRDMNLWENYIPQFCLQSHYI